MTYLVDIPGGTIDHTTTTYVHTFMYTYMLMKNASSILIRDQSLNDCITSNEDKFLDQKSVPDLAASRHAGKKYRK